MTRQGWFILEGQEGARSLEEQMTGLDRAIQEAKGKRVLDVGCAEGLISREFAVAGAKVHAVDVWDEHIATAKTVCAGLPVKFQTANVRDLTPDRTFDIVLLLAIVHKLEKPEVVLHYGAESSRNLVVIRLSSHSENGVEIGKQSPYARCDVPSEMKKHGFKLEAIAEGPRGEPVHYYRRN